MSACSQTPSLVGGDNKITVSSEPAGASVYVMGEVVGTTPVVVDVGAVYPLTYAPELQGDYGRIMLKHAGCEDRIITVSSRMINSGLNTKLDCVAAEAPPVTKPVLVDKTVTQRLQELQLLKEQGLITDEEYQTIRQRILQSL